MYVEVIASQSSVVFWDTVYTYNDIALSQNDFLQF